MTIAGSGGARAQVRISTSPDPVGAPIFYRDVPLMPSEVEKGVIKPIIPSAVPLVGWRLRNVAESGSRLVMEGLPTCANCHSFSRDGKTLGLDVDGPQNDKGTYAIVSLAPRTVDSQRGCLHVERLPRQAAGAAHHRLHGPGLARRHATS